MPIAAALYGWMRVPLGHAQLEALHGTCARLGMAPSDWPCAFEATRAVATQVGASLLTWVAVALPGALLAASGRRFTWAVPPGLAAAATLVTSWLSSRGATTERLFGISTSPIGSGEPTGSLWFIHTTAAVLTDLALVSVPALAIAFVVRPPRRPRALAPKRHAAWVATFAVVGALVALRLLWPGLPIAEYFLMPGSQSGIAVGFVALFAAMLGTDRRWWPWSLAPVAVLLSLGPTMAVAGSAGRLIALSWFANALPLATAGLIASLWRPIAMRLSGGPAERMPEDSRARSVVRSVVVLKPSPRRRWSSRSSRSARIRCRTRSRPSSRRTSGSASSRSTSARR